MAEQSFKVDGGIEAVGIITASTFAKIGGHPFQFLKADGSVDVGSYKTTDTNTQYTISAADHSANKKLLRLNDGSTNKDVILSGGANITLSRVGDEVSIAGTDTTYDLEVLDGSGNKKHVNLIAGGSGAGTTSFVLIPGNNISLASTNNEITITGTDTNTNTTYTYAAIDGNSADEKILRLTSSGAVDDDITLVAGSNISLNRNNERITFTGTDTNTTYSQSAVADGSGNVNIRLTAGGSGSGDDDILVTAGNNITIDSIGPNGFRIAADSEDDTLISVTNRGNTTTNSINIGDLTAGIGTFTGALTVGGNLTVNGTQTIINSNTLQVGDSQVLLNKDETGTPSQNAGINVERGTSTNVLLRWNETNDKWEFTNDGTTYQNIPTTNTTYGVSAVDGDPNKKKIRLTGSNPSSTDDVTLAGGTGITLTRSSDEITITNSAPDTDTTYDFSVPSGTTKLRLDPSTGSDDDVEITGGTNITVTRNSATQLTVSSDVTNNNQLTNGSGYITEPFPSGTRMIFNQTAAPTGWTKDTSSNNRALRLVTGTVGSGGSIGFTNVLNNSVTTSGGSVSNHSLTDAQIPSHRHWVSRAQRDDNNFSQWNTNTQEFGLYSDAGSYSSSDQNHSVGRYTAWQGGTSDNSNGSGHNHGFTHPSFNLNIKYTDVIIAQKD